MSLPHHHHKTNIFTNIIVLVSYTLFQTYNIMSCDALCDCSHVPFHCPRKEKEKNIKSRKILVSKCIMIEV